MARYTITCMEEGYKPAGTQLFQTLEGVQEYVKARWEGVEYMDSPRRFHNDYCTFDLSGTNLCELGARKSMDPQSEDFWNWEWKDVSEAAQGYLIALTSDELGRVKQGLYRAATHAYDCGEPVAQGEYMALIDLVNKQATKQLGERTTGKKVGA